MGNGELTVFLVILVVATLIGSFFGWKDGEEAVFREAVVRGYAEYCPKEDEFAWKGECK